MNDRYLFRGQRVDTKEWVYGLLNYCYSTGSFQISISNGWAPTYNNPDEGELTEFVDVIYETVGQWTTLKDKNGKLGYHKDFIKNNYGDIFLIEWNNQKFAYCLVNIIYLKSGIDLEKAIRYDSSSIDSELVKEWEIIGNIHQDSHLLGGK